MGSEFMIVAVLGLAAIGLVLYSLMPKNAEKVDVVKRRAMGIAADQSDKSLKDKAKARAAGRMMLDKAAPILSRPVMPKSIADQTTLRAKLASAGFRRESAVVLFLSSKTLGGIALAIVAAIYAAGSDKSSTEMLYFAIFGLGIGFMLPNFWLSQTIKKRMMNIRNGMPDSLDLMVVGVEAGLGLDAALLRVSDEMATVHTELAEEFQIATIETQMGTPRSEALSKMAERTAVQEMRALVAVITQAEKLGTSIAKALRNQAESLRTKRRQAAEERAQKTAVKLLIPLILFIFPAIFVVLAGPAAIHLMNTFSSGMVKK